jgi:hypothetical protein
MFEIEYGQHRVKNRPKVENRTVASRESIVTVFWNHHGFQVVTILPLRALFNAPWFIDGNLVPSLEKFFPGEWSAGRKKLVAH